MESTTKELIANAIGCVSVFKQLQYIFATRSSYCNSLPGNYGNPLLDSFVFWRPGLKLSRKHLLPDFSSNYFQKNHP